MSEGVHGNGRKTGGPAIGSSSGVEQTSSTLHLTVDASGRNASLEAKPPCHALPRGSIHA